jgi:Tol biopolymer transport system component
MNADGSNARQITNLSTEASGVLFSPDGKKLVFTSNVYSDCLDDACNKTRLDAEKNSKVKARSYTTLLYRHWTEWETKRRSHLMVVDVTGGPIKDLTPGDRDVPPFSLGGSDDYAISADSKEVCFSMNADPVPATSTNSDLFVVPIAGGDAIKITSNPGADSNPQYSPDGRWLAYRSQARGGYESDRWRLVALERATGRVNIPRLQGSLFHGRRSRPSEHRDDSAGRRRGAYCRQWRQHARRHATHRRRQDHALQRAKWVGAG